MAFTPWTRLALVGALLLGAVGCGSSGGGGGAGAEGGAGGEGGAGDGNAVTVSIADAEIEEGDTGTKELTFTVTLSRASDTTVRVPWETQDGTAFAEGEAVKGRVDY